MKELKDMTDQDLLNLKEEYLEYRKERGRLVSILNYARSEYQKRWNHLKWSNHNYGSYSMPEPPAFIKGHFMDNQLDCLYQQVLDAQEHYKAYRESNKLFNSEEFEERTYYLYNK